MSQPGYEPQNAEERFHRLMEEMGEALQQMGKYKRFGAVALDRMVPGKVWENKRNLLTELADLRLAIVAVEFDLGVES